MPAGLYLAALILSEYREWPWIMGACLIANFAFDLGQHTPVPLILFFFGANTLTAGAAAILIHACVGRRPAMANLREVVGLIGFGGIAGAALGATVAATGLVYFGESTSYWQTWLVWWGANAMAMLLLTPLLLAWHGGAQLISRVQHQPAKLPEAVLLVSGLFLVLWHIAATASPSLSSTETFQVIPFLLWAGLRFGPRGATSITMGVSLVLVHMVVGRLNHSNLNVNAIGLDIFALQTMLAVEALVALIPSVVLEERDRTMLTLRESEEKFSKAFRTSPDVMSISDLETGQYMEVNAAHEKVFGYKREEVIGKSATDIGIFTDATFRDRLKNLLRKKGSFYNVEIETNNRAGERLIMLHSAELIELGGRKRVIRVSHDITERKRTENALEENRRVLATLLSNLPGMVYRCRNDADWTMEFVSEGSRELTGFAPEDLIENRKISFGNLIHADDQKRIWDEVQAALNRRQPFELNYRIHTQDGQEKWVWERGQGIRDSEGNVVILEGFVTDITAARQAELGRQQAIAREKEARIQYTLQLIATQELERTRIARELHDSLGQNLLLIKNRAQLAQLRADEPGNWQNQVENINELVSRAIEEVRQIAHNLHPYRVDHLGLTQTLTLMMDDTARSSGIVFEYKIDDIDEALASDDAINFYRLLQECLNNILKHAGAKKVRVRIERDIGELQLLVEDDGRGFDTGQEETTGKGLGLKNMADRVRILHGDFRLESQPGRGTRIIATIPIQPEKT
jgi:PAS domain S-box-containing protein